MARRRLLVLLALAGAIAAAIAVLASSDNHASRSAARAAHAGRHRVAQRPPRIVHGPHDRPVPILMYHVISVPQPGAPYPGLYTPEPVFAAQMKALAARGYHGVTLAQVDRYWTRGYALPAKPIVVSFDDGYLSDYTHARPVLKRLGWPGVLNLEIHNVQTKGDLSPSQVRALMAAGWEVDSHTLTHPDLTAIGPEQLRTELVASRAYLRRHFGVPADYFCYPAGRYDATVEAAVRHAGYRMATTTQPGLAGPKHDRFALPRIRVDGSDGAAGLLAKLRNPAIAQGGYTGG